MLTSKFFKPLAIAVVLLAVVFGLSAYFQNAAQAGTVTVLSDTVTRHQKSVASDHTIIFRVVSALDQYDYIILDLASGFTTGSVAFGDIDAASGADGSTFGDALTLVNCTGAIGVCSPGSGEVGVYVASDDYIYFQLGATVSTIGANDYIQIKIGTVATEGVNQITNPGTTGSKTNVITTGKSTDGIAYTQTDQGSFALVITDSDEVTVSATVDPTLTFEITSDGTTSTTTCGLGTLTSSTIASCTYYIGVGTNAVTGFSVAVQDVSTYAGLTANAGASVLDDVAGGTVNAGTEEYGFTMTAATSPSGQDVSNSYEFPTEIKVPISATPVITAIAPYSYVNGGTADCTKVEHAATISGTTPAGYYTQTVRYTVTGNF